jgi:hypothetical protein
LGWPSISELLLANPTEVSLTVKRRPRHATANILLPHNMYLRPSSSKRKNRNSANNKPISPVLEKVDSCGDDSSSSSSSPLNQPPNIDDDDDDDDVGGHHNATASKKAAAVNFTENLFKSSTKIKRRATVTGASPTSSRPPVTFVADDQNNSSGGMRLLRPPLMNSKSAPEENNSRVAIQKQQNVSDTVFVMPEVKVLFEGVLHLRKSDVTPSRWVRDDKAKVVEEEDVEDVIRREQHDELIEGEELPAKIRKLHVGGVVFHLGKDLIIGPAPHGVINRPFSFRIVTRGTEGELFVCANFLRMFA